jgi:Flp pilus assembly protein TadG
MIPQLRKRWRAENGSALIEFSLIAFTFVMLLLGVVEMGRMVLVYTTIANAARVGARYAIVHGGERTGTGVDAPSGPGSTTQVQTVVADFAGAGLVNTANVITVVTYPDATNVAGSRVAVTVTYPFDPLIPFFQSLLGRTLSSTSEGVITY